MADPVWAGVGRPPAGPGLPLRVLVPSAAFGPLSFGVGLEVERAELIQAEDDVGLAVFGYDLAVGERVQVLDAGFLGGVSGSREVFQVFMR